MKDIDRNTLEVTILSFGIGMAISCLFFSYLQLTQANYWDALLGAINGIYLGVATVVWVQEGPVIQWMVRIFRRCASWWPVVVLN
jgi:hypothetical protein